MGPSRTRSWVCLTTSVVISLPLNGVMGVQKLSNTPESGVDLATPIVIWHVRPGTAQNTRVGLLYTPDTLATLIARQPPGHVSARIREAARQTYSDCRDVDAPAELGFWPARASVQGGDYGVTRLRILEQPGSNRTALVRPGRNGSG